MKTKSTFSNPYLMQNLMHYGALAGLYTIVAVLLFLMLRSNL